MSCPNKPHVHQLGECPACYERFDVIFLRPDEEVDCPFCAFKVPVPKEAVERVRECLAMIQWVFVIEVEVIKS